MIRKLAIFSLILSGMCLTAHAETVLPEVQQPAPAAEAPAVEPAPAPDATPIGPGGEFPDAAPAPDAVPVKSAAEMLAFLPDTVATYGDKKVTAAEVKDLILPQLERALQAGGPAVSEAELKEGVTQLARQMVDMNLLAELAAKDGFLPDTAAARKELEKALAENPMLEVMMNAQGTTLEKAIEQAALMMAVDKWVETKIAATLRPTDEDLRKHYEENASEFEKPETRTLSHILIGTKEGDTDEAKAAAKKKCEGLLEKVKGGGDFAALAKEFSDCPSGKQSGGSLGDYPKDGPLVKEFLDAAFKLEAGAVSDVVQTEFGYHLIRVDAIQPAGKTPFEKVKDDLAKEMSGPKVNDAVMKALEEARKAANVEIKI
jgi:peptidyl-prolyl cis-trans isomerase C